jgi:tetraacyldisaccharide 4'-kinase
MYVAESIRKLGYKVAIVSRGYKSRAEKTGGIVSDGKTFFMDAENAGDEPYLMASKLDNIPVIIGKDRLKSGKQAVEEFGAEVLVLDDAFQHLALSRNINILLLDYSRPFGNCALVPRGSLREPLSALSRADAFILTRFDISRSNASDEVHLNRHPRPVFKSYHIPYLLRVRGEYQANTSSLLKNLLPVDGRFLEKRNAFAFSGIAVNKDFRNTVCSFGCHLVDYLEFPDHYAYTDLDIQKILKLANDVEADVLLTTEKDYVRVAHRISPGAMELVVVGIKTAFGADTDAFNNFLRSKLVNL